jgi:hypothetical protein
MTKLVSAVGSAVQGVQATKNVQNHNQERAEWAPYKITKPNIQQTYHTQVLMLQ